MSETAGVITVSDPISSLRGSCGSPAKGVDVKIDPETGEILCKGDNIFKNYYGLRDGKKIDNDIDDQVYLHTGDYGKLVDGYLYITGRIKELIITAGGENIPPLNIEEAIMGHMNQIAKERDNSLVNVAAPFSQSNVILVGDQRKYLVILVFKHKDDPEIKPEYVQEAIAINRYNPTAASRAQRVQKFKILNKGLTIENGLVTPTMKLKRRKILCDHTEDANCLYDEE